MKMIRNAFFLVLTLVQQPLKAQNFTLYNYGVEEGLPSSEVYDLFQDSEGFLWISTDNGVVRFDGLKMKSINITDGLPDPVVFEVLEHPKETIWFRTFSGRIAKYEKGKISPYPYNETLAKANEKSFLFSMVFDSLNTLWFSTGPTWGTIDREGKLSSYKIELDHIFYKTVDKSNIIVGPIKHGYKTITIDSATVPLEFSNDTRFSHLAIKALHWRNNLYIALHNNIYKYNGESVSRVYVGDSPIISLTKDRDDNLWIGFYNGGARQYSNENFQNGWAPEFLKKKSVSDILQDHEKGLWFSTLERGVYHVPNPDILHYHLKADTKITTAYTRGNQVITGEANGTLRFIDIRSQNTIRTKKFGRHILAAIDIESNSWVSTTGALYVFDTLFKTVKKIYPGSNYKDFTKDKKGNIWAIQSESISKFDTAGNLLYKSPRFPYRSILALDNKIIVGLHTGVKVYDQQLNLLQSPTALKKYKISKIHSLNDSLLLIGSIGNGFFITDKYFNGTLQYNSMALNIYSVIIDINKIYLGTENGILVIDKEKIIRNKFEYELLTKKNGLPSNQVTILTKISNEKIAALYDSGFTILNIPSLRFTNKKPKFYLHTIKVNDSYLNSNFSYTLPYDSNHVQFSFGYISFNNQNIVARYKIKDKSNWTYATERTINLYSLSPGIYQVEFQYSTDRVHWYPITLPTIKIKPPWWKTLTFQASVFAVSGAMLFLFLRNRIKFYQQRNQLMNLAHEHQQHLIKVEINTLERERSRIAKELHDSVGTDLSALKLIISQVYKQNHSTQIEEQLHSIINEIKSVIYDLTPPGLQRYGLSKVLGEYVTKLSPIGTTIQFNSYGDEIKDYETSIIIFRIIQELISNSLKHSSAKNITIHFNSFNDLLSIVYEDNGIGFSYESVNHGLGLHNIESRIESINGQMKFESGTFGISYTIDIPIKQQL